MSPGPQDVTMFTPKRVSLECEDWSLDFQVDVPVGSMHLREVLPFARALSDAVVNATENLLQADGKTISCKKGCGACCRHLVAISEVEARRIAELVSNFDELRQSELRARFATAIAKFDEANLLESLLNREILTSEQYEALCEEYFAQQIACPFLEDESCSIHEERPITCREYLVTSPAEYCAKPKLHQIDRVRVPIRVFNAVARCQTAPTEHLEERWVPLILALEWAKNPDEPPAVEGEKLFGEFLGHLSHHDPNN
jgi:Fe-S-cluster containining protein